MGRLAKISVRLAHYLFSNRTQEKRPTIDAAVVLIFYRRPETTQKVFDSIRRAKPPRLYLISDGPRNPEDREAVQACRGIVQDIDWPCEVTREYADENLGLRNRVISGLDLVFSKEESAIILEDDCLPSDSFFQYCAALLKRYSKDTRVGLLSGNRFHSRRTSGFSYDFSRDALIWGWATWARVWREFRENLVSLESGLSDEALHELRKSFSSRIKRIQFLTQLKSLHHAGIDSWAFYFASFIRISGSLVIIPERNLVRNIGFGGISTHTKFQAFDVDVEARDMEFPLRHPSNIRNNPKIETLEVRTKSLKWLCFPLLHPIDFVGRFVRYFRLSA